MAADIIPINRAKCPACNGYGRRVIGRRVEGVALIISTRRCETCGGVSAPLSRS